ncbi:cytochrome c3 family protein [Desulfopila aestuarii]|uniref:Uncharacterized protein n=1 Tax=Desulfopila aestuarii DSM 18488 TaxID=1121416 RepID=A0A1M7YCT1_9BACT|nr:cytochrome c3 family protein [Desulfopila aestuarii]SHO50437.1 hypothetical protein SAMN02745220_03443 [Desulfopila aestuarii DSM 18488]
MTKLYTICFLLLIMAFGFLTDAAASESSFVDEIKNTNERFDTRAVPLARQVTEESVLAMEEYQGGSFRVLARKKSIERYRCSRCHTGKPVTAAQGLELTHGNIALAHGTEGPGLTCIDCHHAQERDYLEDKKGRKIDFDHSYQLCGQCHFRQKRDWLGGAHGKRVSNWAGERVVYNCTSCHNPHSPRFAKRFPATYSVPLD